MIGPKFGWRRGNLSAVPKTPSKASPGDKSQAAPVADHPTTKPDKTSAEAAPAHKS